jgi:acyl carrier protein
MQAAQAAAIEDLEQRGVEVRLVSADVGDPVSMQTLFDDLRSSSSPLRGVVHAAGLSSLRPVADLDAASVDAILRSKVAGGWLLHQLTQRIELDFFVLFSSISSVWGSKGLAHYAAANHFLDALAHHRRALGLPALSVNWGPWAEGGMTSSEARGALGLLGVDALEPGAALSSLDALLAGGRSQAIIATVDWDVFKPIYLAKAARPLLDLVGSTPLAAGRSDETAAVLERLRAAHSAERVTLLEGWVQEELAAVLGVSLSAAPEPDARFFDLGMDSLTSVELRRRIERRFGCALEPTLVFDFPTVERLSAHLADCLGVGSSAPAGPLAAAAVMDDPMQRISQMSDEDVERLFAEKVLNQGT